MKSEAFFNNWDSFLYKYHLYYRNLSEKGKKRFVKRVESISNNVDIIGKESLEVNDEIRILVVSNLVQLTFGLRDFWLYGYDYINLYPESFFVKSSGEAVAGSTYQSKIIALSWHDFAMDHLRARNGKNVSLVQYAQALVRTVLNGKSFDIHFGSYLDTWFEIASKECNARTVGSGIEQLNNNQDDVQQVFSRSVEIFFEKPEIFKKELPTTYAHLCLLLNQDPLNVTEDYAYERERLNKFNVLVNLPKAVSPNFKYKHWHWVYNFSFFGLTVCPMVLYFISGNLLVGTFQIISSILLIGLVIGIFSYPYFKQLGLFHNKWLLVLSGVFGFAPCLVTFFLFVNQLYGYPWSAEKSKHNIASYYEKVSYSNNITNREVTFNFSDEFLIDYPKARSFESFPISPTNPINLFDGVEYEIRSGLIGIPIIIKKEVY